MGVCELTGMLIVECRNYTDAVDMKAKRVDVDNLRRGHGL